MIHLDESTLEALWLELLEDGPASAARAHLENCAGCRSAFAALQEELAPLAGLGAELPPPPAPPLPSRRRPWTVVAFGPGLWRAAALALLLLGAGWLLRRPATTPRWQVVPWQAPAHVLALEDGRRAAVGDGLQVRVRLVQGGDTLLGGVR